MTNYWKVGEDGLAVPYGDPILFTHYAGEGRGMHVTVTAPLAADAVLVSEYGQTTTAAELMLRAGVPVLSTEAPQPTRAAVKATFRGIEGL